jgi:hypothetical protein
MKSQKNGLATLSRQQENPGLAQPSEFEITRDADEIFTGQRSDELLKQSERTAKYRFTGQPQDRATEASDASPSSTGRL